MCTDETIYEQRYAGGYIRLTIHLRTFGYHALASGTDMFRVLHRIAAEGNETTAPEATDDDQTAAKQICQQSRLLTDGRDDIGVTIRTCRAERIMRNEGLTAQYNHLLICHCVVSNGEVDDEIGVAMAF